MVPWVRRLHDLGHRADLHGADGSSTGEHCDHFRHRLRGPLSLLHEDLRVPHHSWSSPGHCHRFGLLPSRPVDLGW